MKLDELLFEGAKPSESKVVDVLRNKIVTTSILDDPQAGPDFTKMAQTQRYGGAEAEMMRLVKHLNTITTSGMDSPINSVKYYLEHIGDLTHRLGESMKDYDFNKSDEHNVGLAMSGVEFAIEKIKRAANYPFLRNWRTEQMKLLEELPNAKQLFRAYHDAHKKVPVFNRLQYHGREAAVSLGRADLAECHHHINIMHDMIRSGTIHLQNCFYTRGGYKR